MYNGNIEQPHGSGFDVPTSSIIYLLHDFPPMSNQFLYINVVNWMLSSRTGIEG